MENVRTNHHPWVITVLSTPLLLCFCLHLVLLTNVFLDSFLNMVLFAPLHKLVPIFSTPKAFKLMPAALKIDRSVIWAVFWTHPVIWDILSVTVDRRANAATVGKRPSTCSLSAAWVLNVKQEASWSAPLLSDALQSHKHWFLFYPSILLPYLQLLRSQTGPENRKGSKWMRNYTSPLAVGIKILCFRVAHLWAGRLREGIAVPDKSRGFLETWFF